MNTFLEFEKDVDDMTEEEIERELDNITIMVTRYEHPPGTRLVKLPYFVMDDDTIPLEIKGFFYVLCDHDPDVPIDFSVEAFPYAPDETAETRAEAIAFLLERGLLNPDLSRKRFDWE